MILLQMHKNNTLNGYKHYILVHSKKNCLDRHPWCSVLLFKKLCRYAKLETEVV